MLHRAIIFLNNLAKNPDRMYDYSRLYTLSVASTLIYGKRVSDINSGWYQRFFELMHVARILPLLPVAPRMAIR